MPLKKTMFYNTSATLDQEEESGGGGRLKGGGPRTSIPQENAVVMKEGVSFVVSK
jgi:hypothetical protein